jgi:branched-chain amino acid transport system permease protein
VQETVDEQSLLRRVLPYLVGVAVLGSAPLFLSTYEEGLMTRFLIFALFAMSYNVVFGYAGLLSLGHAAFFGAGGYTVAILKLHYNVDLFWASAPLGVVVATITAALFGLIALRVAGIYFLLVTFALGQMLYSLTWNVKWLSSKGMQGITGIPLPDLAIPGFTLDTTTFYYLVLIFFAISFVLLYRLVRSPFGRALVGIREGETRMEALGYDTWLYKYIAFVISGGFAGIAGVLFTYYNFFVSPNHLGIVTSFQPMVMAIMGGLGTFLGPVVGAAVFIFVENFASIVAPQRWPLILGGLFVLTIMFAREGLGVYAWRLLTEVGGRFGSAKSRETV